MTDASGSVEITVGPYAIHLKNGPKTKGDEPSQFSPWPPNLASVPWNPPSASLLDLGRPVTKSSEMDITLCKNFTS